MCTEAMVIKGGQRTYCDTVGELAKALGVRQKAVSDDGFNFCLCNAHWDRLGARQSTLAEADTFGLMAGGMVIDLDARAALTPPSTEGGEDVGG